MSLWQICHKLSQTNAYVFSSTVRIVHIMKCSKRISMYDVMRMLHLLVSSIVIMSLEIFQPVKTFGSNNEILRRTVNVSVDY